MVEPKTWEECPVWPVASRRHLSIRLVERFGCLERLQRREHHHQPAFHIVGAGARGGLVVEHREVLEGTLFFEDGIHVTDEQDALAALSRSGARVLRHQSAGALDFVHRDPVGFESELLELRHQDFADFADTLEVLGPAVDLDKLPQQFHRLSALGVDGLNDPGFSLVEALRLGL
jgi:hypothetical protein